MLTHEILFYKKNIAWGPGGPRGMGLKDPGSRGMGLKDPGLKDPGPMVGPYFAYKPISDSLF